MSKLFCLTTLANSLVLLAASASTMAGTATNEIPPSFAPDDFGQLMSPVELIPLRKEPDRDIGVLGQRSRGGRLVLTPDTCFFYGRLRLAGETDSKYPGAELNGNKSWTRIEGLDQPDKRVVWPIWLPHPAKLSVEVCLEVPAGADGATLGITLAGVTCEVVTTASDGSNAQPWKITLPVTKPGLYELAVALRKPGRAAVAGVIRQIQITGQGLEDAVLVRSRWRAAAIHARFASSELAQKQTESRLWVMEVRPQPCEDSMYAPITTPFGYFGSTLNPDRTSGGINFSMWSYGRDSQEPPIERLSHLLALGDPRQDFGGFGHEGTGVKPRGWNPFEGQTVSSIVLALRLEPGDPYDTYTGYYLDLTSREWKLYAAGRKWHLPGRSVRSLLPGSFIEVPGPPHLERSAQIRREVDFRGWCRDVQGVWHPIDQMTAGGIRADAPAQKIHGLSPDGWFRMSMGGLEQYQYADSKPVIRSENPQPLPDYMEPDRLVTLDRTPASVEVQDIREDTNTVTLRLVIKSPQQGGKVTVFYGPKDALSFEDRWAHRLELGDKSAGEHTVKLPAPAGGGVCRVLLRGSFGSVWSHSPGVWH